MNWESLNIIGMAGRARSGKDTAADFLVDNYGFVKVSFAWPLYQSLKTMLRVDLQDVAKEEPLEWLGVSPRQLLQTLGTEWGREMIHPDIWVLIMQRRIAELSQSGVTKIVISDVRFQNEAHFVRRHGMLLHLSRDAAPEVNAHCSESGLEVNAGEFLLKNNGTIAELRTDLECFMEEHGGCDAI